MKERFYLLKLKMSGIKNIEKPIEISFYKQTINNDFDPEEYKIKGIYGENGSGKTAIVSAVSILRNLIFSKLYLSDSETQKVLVESVNKKNKSGFIECEYYSEFGDETNINDYLVSFEVRDDNRFYLTGEKLSYKKGKYSKNEYHTVYEIKDGVLVSLIEPKLYEMYKERTQNLLSQRSFATWLFEKDSPFRVDKNSLVTKKLLNNVLFSLNLEVSLDEADNHYLYFLKKRISELENDDLSNGGMNLISEFNNRITRVRKDELLIPKESLNYYMEFVKNLSSFIKIFKPELKAINIDKVDQGDYYKCSYIMEYKDYTVDREFESRGIKKLMGLYDLLNSAVNGSIVFIDELDSNINDVYLDKILEHFVYYGKGQLCFTAHNLSPMSVLKEYKNAITFISSINTVHTWTRNGNQSPENAYKNGFIEDSPFNVDASDFLGIIGGADE